MLKMFNFIIYVLLYIFRHRVPIVDKPNPKLNDIFEHSVLPVVIKIQILLSADKAR